MSILNYNSWRINEEESSAYVSGVSDEDIVAATLVGEAGAEGTRGMQAIRNVLDNRAKKKNTSAAREAIRPKQFSMWNKATAGVSIPSDFKSSKLLNVINMYKDHEHWEDAAKLSSGNVKDITGGATFYYASGGSNKIGPPYWAKNWKQTAVIGNHTFGIV